MKKIYSSKSSRQSIRLFIFLLATTVGLGMFTSILNQPPPKEYHLPGVSHQADDTLPSKYEKFTNPPTNSAPTPPPSDNIAQSAPASQRTQHKYTALIQQPTGRLTQQQPFLDRISAVTAWSLFENTNPSPTIAVIDTGFALNHEALQTRWTDTRWDFVNNDADPVAGTTNPNGDSAFHGTVTAGLSSLLNPNAKIMPIQVLNDDGIGYTDTVAAGVRFAADNGADIISLSLGGTDDDPYLHQQINYAISMGVLVIAAAGNDGCNCMSYPANYSEVLSVGASDMNDNRASFSSYGANLDVLAPGVSGDVCSSTYTSLNPTSAYSCGYSGTSLSTPIVAGLAALLSQQNPTLSPAQLTTIIISRAFRPPSMSTLTTSLQFGYGRIDAGLSTLAATIQGPYGTLLNKHWISLSASVAYTSMTSTCVGVPGAVCLITLNGPNNETISLGEQTLNADGVALFNWDALSLDLSTGVWHIYSTQSVNGQTSSNNGDNFIVVN